MDYSKAIDSVTDTISKASKPLTEAQKMLMAGAMAVWLEKATTEEREACAMECEAIAVNYFDHAKPPYEICAKAIRGRSNVKLRGAL